MDLVTPAPAYHAPMLYQLKGMTNVKIVHITCTASDFAQALAAIFTREGYHTYREGDPHIDFLVETADFTHPGDTFSLADGICESIMEETYHKNVTQPMANLEKFLELLDAGEGKRLFYVTSARASINATLATTGYAYNMSKAALHQFLQMAHNRLRINENGSGYTFRVFDPMAGVVEPQAAAEAAFNYITRRRGTENYDIYRDDENNLTIRDAAGRLHGW